jgi:hypothetical protein
VVEIFKIEMVLIEIKVMITMKTICNDHKILVIVVVDFKEDVMVGIKIVEIKEKMEISDDEVAVVVGFKIVEIKEKMEISDDEVVGVVHAEVKSLKKKFLFSYSISFN